MRTRPPTRPETFIPADTTSEAIERIFAVTGRSPDRTRGEKRALVALRDALGLQVDVAQTNAAFGVILADSLGVEWHAARYTERNTVNLDGLNALLEGAATARRAGSLKRLRDASPDTLTGPTWADFEPARSKIEAVTRIAALTSAPKESLGPGSKERKSVFLNLADALFPDREINRSTKTRLGAALAAALEVPWTDKCESTGETISLLGLNTVLAGAERHLGKLGLQLADSLRTPRDEGDALAAALLDGLPQHWEGRAAVKWLADRGLRGANDNEWQGFFGEERAKIALAKAFTPKPNPPVVRFGNTVFDYSLNWVWDIKVHTETQIFSARSQGGGNETILNDELAIRRCVHEQGLGFLIISGAGVMDEAGEFVDWHRRFKAARGSKPPAPSNSGQSRMRKAAFRPMHVEAFWCPNTAALDAAILSGQLKVRAQGRQAPSRLGAGGAVRANKFELRMRQARAGIVVARYDWQVSSSNPTSAASEAAD